MTNKLIDLNQIRAAWTQRYGANTARRMMSGVASGLAYDSARGLRRPARDQEDDETSGLDQIKVFLKNRLGPDDFARLEQMLQQLSGGEGEQPDHNPDPMPSKPQGRDEPPTGGRADLLPGPQPNHLSREDLRGIGNSYAQD